MDIGLMDAIDRTLPRMNRQICDGIAVEQIEFAEKYLDEVWRDAAESFPPQFTYVGSRPCTPLEAYEEMTKPKNHRGRTIDRAQNDTYMVRYEFRYTENGVSTPIYRYARLVFLRDGGLLYLKGTRYRVTPVYSGRIINVEQDRIYMQAPRVRLAFNRLQHSFFMNDKLRHSDVVWSQIFHVDKTKVVKNRRPVLLHYMLAEYGLTETMRQFFGADIIAYREDQRPANVTAATHTVFRSRGVPPAGMPRGPYTPTRLHFAIPTEQVTAECSFAIAGLIYILDWFPEAMDIDDMDIADNWLRLLCRFNFKDNSAENKRFEEMRTHRKVVKKYMDLLTRRLLKQDGIECDTIYDLFKYIIFNFNDMLIHNDIGSMYSQELVTVKHLHYDLVYNIFSLMFDLEKLTEDKITKEKVIKRMNRLILRDSILGVTKHGEVTPESAASDCKPYSTTTRMVSQGKISSHNRSSKNHGVTTVDPALLLHASQIEVGTYAMMSSADPTGRSRCNPFMYFGQPNYITRNPKMVDYIDRFAELIKR